MVNINSIEKEKKNIILNFKPEEFEAYLKSLVAIYYESFLVQDKEKHLTVTNLIEEAVDVYETKYSNTSYNRLVYEVNKANELLAETLEAKDKQEIELTKVIVENIYTNNIEKVIHDKLILESLVASYVKAPSEELASVVKDVLHLVESDLVGIKFLLENKVFTENVVYAEEVKILKDYYSSVVDLAERINSF